MTDVIHEFKCADCGDMVKVIYKEESAPDQQEPLTGVLPLPKSAKILRSFGVTKYVDHENHTLAIELKPNGDINRVSLIPKLQTMTDNLVQSIVNLTRILNGYLFGSTSKIKPTILFMSQSTQISNFLAVQASTNLISNDKIALKRQKNLVQVEFDRIGFVLVDLEIGAQMLQKKKKISSIIDQTELDIKSIVIDCADIDESIIVGLLSAKRLNISKDDRIILAFNPRLNKIPPLQVKDLFEDGYSINNISMINYDTLEGLKSINLQSYYNLVENEYHIRDLHEKYLKSKNL